MYRYIIEESGFPRNREFISGLQDSFTKPIDELLKLFPGNRILWGCEKEDNGGGNVLISAGQIVYNGIIYDIEAYDGADTNFISLFETIQQDSFNVGTKNSPINEDRDFIINWSGQWGNIGGNDHLVDVIGLSRGRQVLEFLQSGTVFLGQSTSPTAKGFYNIEFPNIGTNRYFVLATIRPIAGQTLTESVPFITRNHQPDKFTVVLDNDTARARNYQPLLFDFYLIAKNLPVISVINP